jgi:sulfhydrogenase subunit beta (sulfur reductase)
VSLTIIPKQELNDFIRGVLQHYRVAGPVETNGHYAFDIISDPTELRLDYPTTILPPKKYLLPPCETLFRYDLSGKDWIRPDQRAEPTVVLGVHTCDLYAIQLLDAVFWSGHADPKYLERRSNTLIVSIECLAPCDEFSFCKSMGTLTAEEGYDLHFTDLGEVYGVDIGTEAGENLITEYANPNPASAKDIKRLNAVLSEKWPKFSYRLDFDVSDLPSLLSLSMKSPLWSELAERCLSCAACTNVCPTCFCFDVKDEIELDLQHGQRVRIWDSCQLDMFATVAGGHNFRQDRALRLKHRFLRKGKYILEDHGHLGCVGCGRCARACIVDISPVNVFNELYHQQES